MPERLDRALSILNNGTIDGQVRVENALTDSERADLETRLTLINGYLAPAEPSVIAANLRKVLTALPSQNATQEMLTGRVAIYMDVLAGVPEFAITRVCFGYISGSLGDKTWAPSAGTILQECQKLMLPHEQVRDRIAQGIATEVANSNTQGDDARIRKQSALMHAKKTLDILARSVATSDIGSVFDRSVKYEDDNLTVEERAKTWLATDLAKEREKLKFSPQLAKLMKDKQEFEA
jgi:hypothetical protein